MIHVQAVLHYRTRSDRAIFAEGLRGKVMRRPVGPFQIIRHGDQFQVRKGREIISTHLNFLAAEDAALRIWLDPEQKDFDSSYEPQSDNIERAADATN